MLFNLANLPYWLFLGIGVMFFVLVIVSGGGDDDLDTDTDVDFDVDADADFDIDTDANFDIDTDSEIDINTDSDSNNLPEFLPLQILGWLGLGKVPLMLLLAIYFTNWGVSGWILNVIIGSFIGEIPGGFLGGIIFFVSLFISMFIGGLIARPVGKIFASFGEDVDGNRLIGCVGIVSSKTIPYLIEGKIGQVDVLDSARNLVTISVSLPDWAKVIPHRGESILIIDQQQHCYIGIAKDSYDEDKWLNGNLKI